MLLIANCHLKEWRCRFCSESVAGIQVLHGPDGARQNFHRIATEAASDAFGPDRVGGIIVVQFDRQNAVSGQR